MFHLAADLRYVWADCPGIHSTCFVEYSDGFAGFIRNNVHVKYRSEFMAGNF
jgi:hypothetical protein